MDLTRKGGIPSEEERTAYEEERAGSKPRKAPRGIIPGIALGERDRSWSHSSTYGPRFPGDLGHLTFEIPPRRATRGGGGET